MKDKLLMILCVGIILLTTVKSYGQLDLEDNKVLKLGYRMGYTKFNPAYYAFPNNSTASNKEYKDYIIPSNLDIWFGKNSEHAFYDANIGGLCYTLGIYTYDLATGKEPNWINEKMRKAQKNFSSLKEAPRGSDFDVFDMKLGFGGKGIFVGGQVGYTYFGPGGNGPGYDSDSNHVYTVGGSYFSYGLGLHYNKTMDNFTMQNSFTVDALKNKKQGIDGIGFKLESTIYLGNEKGFYFAPSLKWRSMTDVVQVSTLTTTPSGTGYTNTDVSLKMSSFAFGLRAGFYLSE